MNRETDRKRGDTIAKKYFWPPLVYCSDKREMVKEKETTTLHLQNKLSWDIQQTLSETRQAINQEWYDALIERGFVSREDFELDAYPNPKSLLRIIMQGLSNGVVEARGKERKAVKKEDSEISLRMATKKVSIGELYMSERWKVSHEIAKAILDSAGD